MKRYKVYWTKEATLDLWEIVDYISKDRISPAKSIYKKVKLKMPGTKHLPGKIQAST